MDVGRRWATLTVDKGHSCGGITPRSASILTAVAKAFCPRKRGRERPATVAGTAALRGTKFLTVPLETFAGAPVRGPVPLPTLRRTREYGHGFRSLHPGPWLRELHAIIFPQDPKPTSRRYAQRTRTRSDTYRTRLQAMCTSRRESHAAR